MPTKGNKQDRKFMKNVWKGLIVGALTGMVGGSVMDMATAARRKTGHSDVAGKAKAVAGHKSEG